METALPQYLFVVDLEATCDERQRIPANQMETIEVGGVLVATETLHVVADFQTFVRPVRHPKLTAFCMQLTTITQAQVDDAPGFLEAMENVRGFLAGREALFCSWGDYDRKQLERDAKFHRCAPPLGAAHLNLKARFSEVLGDGQRYGMAAALERVGLTLQGTHHRGLDDARNIARLLPWCLGRRIFPGTNPVSPGDSSHDS